MHFHTSDERISTYIDIPRRSIRAVVTRKKNTIAKTNQKIKSYYV